VVIITATVGTCEKLHVDGAMYMYRVAQKSKPLPNYQKLY